MALKKITGKDFNTAIKTLTTSGSVVWWKTLETTDDGTELCFVMGWGEGYDEEEDLYQQDGYTLCSKIGYKHRNLMVMDYSDFYMPYDEKSGEVWDTDMAVGKVVYTDDNFDVKWYNDEAQAIWKKYGEPNEEGTTALDLMESKKKEAKKNEKMFMLYDIHQNYPDFGKMSCWRNPQFWKDYEDYYSKAYPTMGIKITMKDNDSVDVTSNGKFIMNYSWKNGRHRATAEDGSGFKHPGFGFRDDLSMIYRGATGKEMGPYNAVYVDESKKKEAKKHTCSMQKKKESLAKLQEMHPMFKNWNPRNQAQVNNTLRLAMAECPQDMPELIKIVKEKGFDVPSGLTPATGWGSFESKSNICSMQKKKESVSKKNESSLSHFVVSNAETALDTVCDEILSHTNDDFVINDADAAEIVGKYAIMRELDGFGGYSGTADEFAEWVDGVLSGSPLDGSPFGSAEATEYARKIWSEED